MKTIIWISIFAIFSCNETPEPVIPQNDKFGLMDSLSQDSVITFLALGDSYTYGESVSREGTWPAQLVNLLQSQEQSLKVESARIVARTGWTTDELQAAITKEKIDSTYDLVSLLIGVNNQYRGYPDTQYRAEFEQLLVKAIAFAGGDRSRVFIISIPDYGVTPFGTSLDPGKIAEEIDQYNEIARSFAKLYDIAYFDITEISREAKNDATLIAGDGLHPSENMYKRWVDLVLPWVKTTIRR